MGLIYIFVSDTDNGNIQAIDIFSPDGKFLYSSILKFEENNLLNEIVSFDSYLYVSMIDKEGTERAAKFSIKHPQL
jgi:hypothetical protein